MLAILTSLVWLSEGRKESIQKFKKETYDHMTIRYPHSIGLTGHICTGKTTVARILERHGVPVLYADLIGKEMSETLALKDLVQAFGSRILTLEGHLDRSVLRHLFLTEPLAQSKLECIIHPLVEAYVDQKAQNFGQTLWAYESALLFETKKHDLFSTIWVTCCSQETQILRLKERGLTKEDAMMFLTKQLSQEEKIKKADFLISTDLPIEKIEDMIHQKLGFLKFGDINHLC